MKLLRLLFVFIILNSGVVAFADEKSDKPDQTQPVAPIVTYEIIQQGTYSGLKEPAAKVIQKKEEWEEAWKKHVSMLVPQPLLPEIDFNTTWVVLLAAGEQKTSGYSVFIKDMTVEANDIVIRYRLIEPPANSFTLQVFTQPYLMMKVLKPQGTIRLVKE